MARLLVGTSGWVYKHWSGVFYPEDSRERDWFDFYSNRFDTVEVNYSFYRLPSRAAFENWRKTSPPGFLFTVKANRYITHVKKLKDAGEAVSNFYGNLSGLGAKCAAVLFQLPPRWRANPERLEEFLEAVPRKYRLVFEFRDQSWLNDDVFEILHRHNAALCAADSPHFPSPRVMTADFAFFRMHCGRGLTAPNYSKKELDKLAGEIHAHSSEGLDVFVYFNNDYKGYATRNALAVREMLEGKAGG